MGYRCDEEPTASDDSIVFDLDCWGCRDFFVLYLFQ